MNKNESIRTLVLLSQLEGYIAGKISGHMLPVYIAEELSDICELLAKKIRDDSIS